MLSVGVPAIVAAEGLSSYRSVHLHAGWSGRLAPAARAVAREVEREAASEVGWKAAREDEMVVVWEVVREVAKEAAREVAREQGRMRWWRGRC